MQVSLRSSDGVSGLNLWARPSHRAASRAISRSWPSDISIGTRPALDAARLMRMAARALSLLALASAAHAFAPAHKSKFHPIRTVGSASICSGAGGEGAAATGSCVPAPLTGRIYAQVHARRGRRVLRRAVP